MHQAANDKQTSCAYQQKQLRSTAEAELAETETARANRAPPPALAVQVGEVDDMSEMGGALKSGTAQRKALANYKI